MKFWIPHPIYTAEFYDNKLRAFRRKTRESLRRMGMIAVGATLVQALMHVTCMIYL